MIGYLAAILTASTMVPQILKSLRTKSVEDLSFVMIIFYSMNALCWIAYGISIGAPPLILADTFALFAGLTQLFLKIRYAPVSAIENSTHSVI